MIHPKSHIADGCHIGNGTVIWQFASVVRHANIGEFCRIGAGAVIDAARIGSHCKIGAGTFIPPGVKIGRRVFIGPNVTFTNDAWPSVDEKGFGIQSLISGDYVTTEVEDGASIGAGAIILPGVRVGANSLTAAGVVVRKSIPSNSLYRPDGEIVKIEAKEHTRMVRVDEWLPSYMR